MNYITKNKFIHFLDSICEDICDNNKEKLILVHNIENVLKYTEDLLIHENNNVDEIMIIIYSNDNLYLLEYNSVLYNGCLRTMKSIEFYLME